MQQPSPSGAAAGGGGGEEDPFHDIVIPPEHLLPGLDDDDGRAYIGGGVVAAVAEKDERRWLAVVQPGGSDGWEKRLSMTYQGRAYVFDSVPPQKVETILMLLNGYELAPPQSSRPQPTHLVQPIVVPRDFDRTAAVSRYREKRKRARSSSTSRPTSPSGVKSPPGAREGSSCRQRRALESHRQ
ncbi:hypothetical protein PVAP13_8KG289600 [Panicum virgatum]|uniref:Tify domain-containing protein n=1 Tax=Panicum virgatum TaxID=38727 RepID=A0A8T0PP99_PANVG|nr:hypothetical protein PVAP13_8KG289600 [Panicum virgatum]